jgi:NADH-quinone oxidoreductase subunit A
VKKITKRQGWFSMADPPFNLADYFPIFLYLLAILGFVAVSLVAAHTIGPNRKTEVKLMPYESGMDPVGDARQRFDVKFYLLAIMFLVFDVELLFLYPWAVVAYQEGGLPELLQDPVFWGVLVFILLLLVAYIYDWRRGVFRWR